MHVPGSTKPLGSNKTTKEEDVAPPPKEEMPWTLTPLSPTKSALDKPIILRNMQNL
jgi:hypothetical protein